MLYAYLIKFPHIFATTLFKEHIDSLSLEHYRITLHNSKYCTIEFNRLSKRDDHIVKTLTPHANIKLRLPNKQKYKYITIQE